MEKKIIISLLLVTQVSGMMAFDGTASYEMYQEKIKKALALSSPASQEKYKELLKKAPHYEFLRELLYKLNKNCSHPRVLKKPANESLCADGVKKYYKGIAAYNALISFENQLLGFSPKK